MNMQTAVITCFKKFLMTGGRAGRSEFWWFMLFNFIAIILLMIIIFPLAGLWVLVTIFPTICVFIRRFQDMNLSGWWFPLWTAIMIGAFLIIFTKLIGYYDWAELPFVISWIFVWLLINCKKGTAGDNRFGADPLAEENPH